jgi:hypothetical protein
MDAARVIHAHPAAHLEMELEEREPDADGTRSAMPLAEAFMRYILAWMLGVPGGLILLWFLFNHMH